MDRKRKKKGQGDTSTLRETLAEAGETVAPVMEREVGRMPNQELLVDPQGIEDVVADKGCHSGGTVHAVAVVLAARKS